tara:strand:+ start:2682 stop:5663 length:2982 start_codon:yes stop_codon:yes gene_type:complete
MATKWISPTWRMPENSNQSKLDNYSLDFRINVPDKISLANTMTLSYETGFSFSFWVKFNTSVQSGFFSNSLSRGLYYRTNSGSNSFAWYNNGNYIFSSPTAFQSDTWYHIVFINDNGSLKFYANTEAATNNGSMTSSDDYDFENISGATGSAGITYLDGSMSQFCIFDYALTDGTGGTVNQIGYLYNNNDPVNPTVANPQNPMAIAGPAPVAYYDLGGSSTGDASASPNTLTVPNSSVPSATVFNFDGPNALGFRDYIDLSPIYDGSIDLGVTSTISMWVNLTGNNLASGYALLGESSNTGAYTLFMDSGSIYFRVNASLAIWSASSKITLGNWHNILITRNSSNEPELFIDGQSEGVDQQWTGGDPGTSSTKFDKIGVRYSSSNPVDGQISNVQAFNTALPATGSNSVETIYNNGTPLTSMSGFTSLKAWWRMNIDTSTWNGNEWLIGNSISTYNKSFSLSTNGNYLNFGNTFFDNYIQTGEDYPVGTISFWVKSRSTLTGYVYIRAIQLAGNFSWDIKFFKDNVIGFVTGSGNNYRAWNLHTSITDNGWHHYALVIPSGTDKTLSKMYMDSKELSVNYAGPAVASGTYSMSWLRAGDSKWLDYSNIQFYNTAFSNSDISTLYNGGVPLAEASLKPSNLKGWWKMDDTATFSTNWNIPDASGNNNPGVSGGTPSSTAPTESSRVDGLVSVAAKSSGMDTSNLVNSNLERSIPYSSYSMDFDGLYDYINVDNANTIGRTQKISYSLWVKLDSNTRQYFVGNWASSNNGSGISIEASGKLVFQIADGPGSSNNGNDSWTYSIVSSADFNTYAPAGQWNHIVGSYDGTDAKIYINGTLRNTWTPTQPYTITYPNPFRIAWRGAGTGPVGYLTNGKLSNISLYDYGLTDNQVLQIYNGGVPNDISNLSPVAWWSFSGDSYYNGANWIIPDLSGNSNNGTSNNMGGTELVGDGPGSEANGVGASMNIPLNLKSNAPNSSSNAFSVNMSFENKTNDTP